MNVDSCSIYRKSKEEPKRNSDADRMIIEMTKMDKERV